MISYRATLDVSRELARYVAGLLRAERRQRATPAGTRKLSCFWQAVVGLRWFRDRTLPDRLACDHGMSRATAYRHLDEVIDVLAQQAPDLQQALQQAREQHLAYIILERHGHPCRPADRENHQRAATIDRSVARCWISCHSILNGEW